MLDIILGSTVCVFCVIAIDYLAGWMRESVWLGYAQQRCPLSRWKSIPINAVVAVPMAVVMQASTVRAGSLWLVIVFVSSVGCSPSASVNIDKPAAPALIDATIQNPSLVLPPELASAEGKLTVKLLAAPGKFEIADQQFEGMLYNGAYLPPVWRVQPGDTLNVEFRNQLPEMTNLHFHGMNVSPRGDSDNVFIHVHPGESFAYRVEIPPSHPPGLFWYHPHAHGRTSPQILAGLSGGIVVEGSDRFYPLLAKLKERIMLLKHIPHPTIAHQEIVTLNGLIAPTIAIQPGEIQYWRIGNIGANLFLKLKLEGMALYLIGTDGHYLQRPKKVDELWLSPASRVEVLVVGGSSGRYAFKSVSFLDEAGKPPQPERLLGVAVSEGPAAAEPAEAEATVTGQRVEGPRYIEELRNAPISRRRLMTYTRNADQSKFFINGQTFDPERTDVTVTLGDTEEWTVRNDDTQLHNFHIHQTPFLVTEINGKPAGQDSLYDTFPVPAKEKGKPGEIKVVIPFTDPTIVGRFVWHCHMAKHEDKGMMQTIEVVRPVESRDK